MSKITAYNTPYTSRNGGVRFDSLVIGIFCPYLKLCRRVKRKMKKGKSESILNGIVDLSASIQKATMLRVEV